jgi:hypothetical protein
MKSACTTLSVAALIALAGCNKGTEGGPGASKSSNKSGIGQAEDTFNLSVPTLATKLKQGEAKVVTISIKRGKNSDQDVTLNFAGVPQGVTLDPASPVIKHSDTETKLSAKATDDAAVGDFTITVTGHPAKGADATNDLKLTVEKK